MTREERDIAALAREAELLDLLELHQIWLRAALDCKDWIWDSDQREAAEDCYKATKSAQASSSPSQTTPTSSEPQTAASEAINDGNVDAEVRDRFAGIIDLNERARLNGYTPLARGGPDWVALYEDEHGKGSWNRR